MFLVSLVLSEFNKLKSSFIHLNKKKSFERCSPLNKSHNLTKLILNSWGNAYHKFIKKNLSFNIEIMPVTLYFNKIIFILLSHNIFLH